MGFVDRLAERMGYVKRPESAGAIAPLRHHHARMFQAAQTTRLDGEFPTANTSFDYDLRQSLKPMRGRARHLAQNNDYAKKFLQMCVTHIVGANGFALQSQVKFQDGKPDEFVNAAIEAAFYDWAQRGVCETSGRLSFIDVQQLLVETAARDGEFLVRKIKGADNAFGFALQILDSDRLDVDRNEELRNGNRITMGVEKAPGGQPVAYWLLRFHPSTTTGWQTSSKWERVPAEDIYHGFRASRPEQTRGCPWMHTAISRLNHLGAFEYAAVVAARAGASKMGWIVSPDGENPDQTEQDATGQAYSQFEPGTIGTLPAGYDFKGFDPDYPHAQFDPFVKATLRGIASGLGVAYHTLANDLEGVNFSSARAGTLEERDNWMAAQEWFAACFLYPLFTDWLNYALLRGAITFANGTPLPIVKYDRFNRPVWQGRRWQWVDPSKDIEANVAAINAGLKSRREVIAEQGRDLDDVWTQLQQEEKRAKELGLQLKEQPPKPAPAKGKEDGTTDEG